MKIVGVFGLFLCVLLAGCRSPYVGDQFRVKVDPGVLGVDVVILKDASTGDVIGEVVPGTVKDVDVDPTVATEVEISWLKNGTTVATGVAGGLWPGAYVELELQGEDVIRKYHYINDI